MFIDNVGSRYVTFDNVRTVAKVWQIFSRRSQPIGRKLLTFSSSNNVWTEFLRPTGKAVVKNDENQDFKGPESARSGRHKPDLIFSSNERFPDVSTLVTISLMTSAVPNGFRECLCRHHAWA